MSEEPHSRHRAGQPVPCLGLIEDIPEKAEKESTVSYMLKVKADASEPTRGSPAAATYKFFIRRFDEGKPYEYITLVKGLNEIWTQNRITAAKDRLAVIHTLIRGES